MQLQGGISDAEERKQREICANKHGRRDEMNKCKLSEMEIEREEECGICMELSSKVVLPNCSHSLCMKCYKNWYVNFLNKICSCMEKKIRTIHYLCLVYSRDHWVVDRVVDEKLFKEQETNFRPSGLGLLTFLFFTIQLMNAGQWFSQLPQCFTLLHVGWICFVKLCFLFVLMALFFWWYAIDWSIGRIIYK